MKIFLRTAGFFGLVLFSSFFGLTYGIPQQVEASAKGFVKNQIEKEIRQKAAVITESSLANKAKILADKLGLKENQLTQDITNNLPEKIANIMAKMCGYDCEKKKQLADDIRGGFLMKIQNLKVGQINLTHIIQGKYVEIIGNLKTDLRVFTLSNAAMFLVLLLISLLKPQAIKHLYLPGVLLLASTLIATSIYLFGQNWFYTIVYNNYMGLAYLVYLGIIFGLLLDIALNKCRVTSFIFNMIGNALSSIGSVHPC